MPHVTLLIFFNMTLQLMMMVGVSVACGSVAAALLGVSVPLCGRCFG